MRFANVLASLALALAVYASPVAEPDNTMVAEGNITLVKREISYGNPDLVTDMGDRFKLNYGRTDNHPNACPGHYICYLLLPYAPHDDVSLGDPDNFVDEGNRWRLNYGSTRGHPNACDGHYICYIYK